MGCFFSGVEFRSSSFEDGWFEDSTLYYVKFSDVNFKKFIFDHGRYNHVSFIDSDLSNTRFNHVVLKSYGETNALRRSIFVGSTFTHCEISSLYDFGENDFEDVQFEYTNCSHLNFSKNNCKRMQFSYSDLTKSNFSRTNLENSGFYRVDAREADFSGSNLQNVHFTGADLRGANFEGANFKNTVFQDVLIDSNIFYKASGLKKCTYLYAKSIYHPYDESKYCYFSDM